MNEEVVNGIMERLLGRLDETQAKKADGVRKNLLEKRFRTVTRAVAESAIETATTEDHALTRFIEILKGKDKDAAKALVQDIWKKAFPK